VRDPKQRCDGKGKEGATIPIFNFFRNTLLRMLLRGKFMKSHATHRFGGCVCAGARSFFPGICDGTRSSLVSTAGCRRQGHFLISLHIFSFLLFGGFFLLGHAHAQGAHTARGFLLALTTVSGGENRAPKRRLWRPGAGSMVRSDFLWTVYIYLLIVLCESCRRTVGDKSTSETRTMLNITCCLQSFKFQL